MGAGFLGFLVFASTLLATDTPIATGAAKGLGRAKSAVAHSDCLKQCHQPSRPMQYGFSAKPDPQAFRQGPISAVCLGCHQGPPAAQTDMGATKLPAWKGTGSSHMDGPFLERSRSYARFVDMGTPRGRVLTPQCNGCHDVHAKDRANSLGPAAFDASGKAMKIRPILAAQICFGCHAGPEAARLGHTESDLGAVFGPSATSAHRPGTNVTSRPDLPSLRVGLFGGTLDCTSCHDNSDPTGPRGPHASAFPKLLKASFGREGDIARTGDRANLLCYTCHDERSILGNRSFPLHAQHINGFTGGGVAQGFKNPRGTIKMAPRPKTPWNGRFGGMGIFSAGVGQPTSCATCHDPHGSRKNPALISFDKAVVTRSSVGAIDFQRTGLGQGNCTLTCHGYDHVQTRY